MPTTSRTLRLTATARQMYAGRALLVGEEFEVPETDARDLIALGFAQEAKGEPESKRAYKRRDMKAEP